MVRKLVFLCINFSYQLYKAQRELSNCWNSYAKETRGEQQGMLRFFRQKRRDERSSACLRLGERGEWGCEVMQVMWKCSDAGCKTGVLWVWLFLARRHIWAPFLFTPRLHTSLYSKPVHSAVHHMTGAASTRDETRILNRLDALCERLIPLIERWNSTSLLNARNIRINGWLSLYDVCSYPNIRFLEALTDISQVEQVIH